MWMSKERRKKREEMCIRDSPEVTEGAAITALKGCEGLPDGEPILFNDCDHLFICSAFNAFCEKGKDVYKRQGWHSSARLCCGGSCPMCLPPRPTPCTD